MISAGQRKLIELSIEYIKKDWKEEAISSLQSILEADKKTKDDKRIVVESN